MAKMKRSEFKVLVKECVRECLREIMQEQLNPSAVVQEMLLPQARVPTLPQNMVFNPMDDHQMQIRQELARQRGMFQNQMQRQGGGASLQKQALAPLSELAGLGPNDIDPNDRSSGHRYATENTGYLSPADRLRQSMGAPAKQSGFNPHLDTPVAGSRQQQQQTRPAFQRLDPDLDAPVNGGGMRPPDPQVMKEIFAHTAQTTFAQQAAHGHVRPGASQGGGGGQDYTPPVDQFAAVVQQSNPEDLFEGSQNWAHLAFR